MRMITTQSICWHVACFFSLRYTVLASQRNNDNDIENIISSMSLKQKINQMAQIDMSLLFTNDKIDQQKIEHYFGEEGIGSLLVVPVQQNYLNASEYRLIMTSIQNVTKSYALPPVIAGIDSVHGANYIKGSILFPQQLNMACTFEPDHAKYAGDVAARDTVAAGINWLFSPIIGLGVNPLWARMYETFGEDPYVVGKFASKLVEGIQQSGRAGACGKHFVGYSAPWNGHDRSPSRIPVRQLYQYFVRPWREVIKNANPLTIMESYTEYDGVPNVANRQSLEKLLRQELGFEGVLVTDYHEIENLIDFHKVATDINEAVGLTLLDGSVDMSMLPFNTEGWISGVTTTLNEAKDPANIEERIHLSVQRILKLKQRLNMFDEDTFDNSNELEKVGDPNVRYAALNIARESIVLAKNEERTLPILVPKDFKVKVHVTGPTSNSIRYQTGGWTIFWQGPSSDEYFTYGQTVLDAAKEVNEWEVTSSCGVDIMGNPCHGDQDSEANDQIVEADYIVVCIGEENYTEKPGDIRDLSLTKGQRDFVTKLKKSTNAKIIVIYFGGRPRLLGNIVEDANAVLLAFLPGPDSGQAITELITGKKNFSGKLPITYPKFQDMGGVPYWHSTSDQCTESNNINEPLPHYSYKRCEVEWPFGHGLSYTNFEYSNFQVDSGKVKHFLPWSKQREDSFVNISVDIKNAGVEMGTETAMFFIFIESRHVTPEYKLLVHFERFVLHPGKEKTIHFQLTSENFRHVGPHDDTHDILQIGERLRVGVGPGVDCRIEDNLLCSDFISLEMGEDEDYDPACENACALLEEHRCLVERHSSPHQCYNVCLQSDSPMSIAEQGWGWSYMNCIESILSDNRRSPKTKCDAVQSLCRKVFFTDVAKAGGASETTLNSNLPPDDATLAGSTLATIAVSIFAGILGIIIIISPFFSRFRNKVGDDSNTDIEFASVNQREVI